MSQEENENKSKEEEFENQSNQNIETENKNSENIENNENNENKTSNKNSENNNNIENNETNQNLENEKKVYKQPDYDYEKNKKEIMEKIELRKFQADVVEKYINETGIGTAFQIIFSELLSKKIKVENYYEYTASRLRQIGREQAAIDRKNKKK